MEFPVNFFIRVSLLSYILNSFWSNDIFCIVKVNTALEAVGRIAGGLASHTLYTAVVTVGVYLLFSTAYKKYRLFGLWCVVSTVANHFIWNSPFFETEHRINIVVGFLFAFLVATFIEVYRLVLKEKKTDLEI